MKDRIMNLTFNQIVAMILVVLGVLTASAAQLTDLFGPTAAKNIASAAGLLSSIMAGFLSIVTGQSNLVRDVQAMPGIERIVVNEKANTTLATLAVDPAQPKIESTPGAATAVASTAASVQG